MTIQTIPKPFEIVFPQAEKELEQNEECFLFRDGDDELKIGMHEYGKLFSIQGLYEHLMCDRLRCVSHHKIVHMLIEEVIMAGESLNDLRALDIGVGNGLVGEVLYRNGVRSLIGIDILKEATSAVQRDRPQVYRDCYVLNLDKVEDKTRKRLRREKFNLLTCGSALDFNDIPPTSFVNAYNLLVPNAWFVINIKGEIHFSTQKADAKGSIAAFIQYLIQKKMATLYRYEIYQHRLSTDGRPIFYTAVLGRKLRDIPAGNPN